MYVLIKNNKQNRIVNISSSLLSYTDIYKTCEGLSNICDDFSIRKYIVVDDFSLQNYHQKYHFYTKMNFIYEIVNIDEFSTRNFL